MNLVLSSFFIGTFHGYALYCIDSGKKITDSEWQKKEEEENGEKQLIEPGKQNAFNHLKRYIVHKTLFECFPSELLSCEAYRTEMCWFISTFYSFACTKPCGNHDSCKPTNFSLNFNTDHNIVLLFI